jgi:RND family efflux transporter MFP subunit
LQTLIDYDFDISEKLPEACIYSAGISVKSPLENEMKPAIDRPNITAFCCLLMMIPACAPQAGRQLAKPPELTVTTAKPVSRQIADSSEFTGRTESIGRVEVRSRVSGYLVKVHFKEGQEVKKGELLFEIDPRPFQAKIGEAEAKLKADEAKLRELTAEYLRNKALHDRRALSLEELQQSEAKKDVVSAEILGDKAALDQAKLDLEFSRIIAPVDGRTGDAALREGNLVSNQSPNTPALTTIVPQNPMYVYFDVDERTYIERLKKIRAENIPPDRIRDAKIQIQMGLADSRDFPFEGVIDFVDNRVDPSTGTIRARAVFDNSKRLLAAGFFTRVRINDEKSHAAILFPELAILTDQGLKYLWVVDAAGKVSRKNVRLGTKYDGLREITEGLSIDDQIILIGIQKVREGATVKTELVTFDDAGQVAKIAGKAGSGAESQTGGANGEKSATAAPETAKSATNTAAPAR